MSDEIDHKKNAGQHADKKRGQRNIAIALMILGFVVLVYLVTIMRLGGAVAERSF